MQKPVEPTPHCLYLQSPQLKEAGTIAADGQKRSRQLNWPDGQMSISSMLCAVESTVVRLV